MIYQFDELLLKMDVGFASSKFNINLFFSLQQVIRILVSDLPKIRAIRRISPRKYNEHRAFEIRKHFTQVEEEFERFIAEIFT